MELCIVLIKFTYFIEVYLNQNRLKLPFLKEREQSDIFFLTTQALSVTSDSTIPRSVKLKLIICLGSVSSTRLAFAIWMIPTRSLFYCYIFVLFLSCTVFSCLCKSSLYVL